MLEPIAAGLDYAHGQGILHRDLKPGNIFITQRQEIKLLDFGLAYRLHRSSTMVGIQETDASGTPEYMPPEAFVAGEPDKARDIYALACLTYEMLTGEPPFSPKAARLRNPELLPGKPSGLTEAAWEVLKSGLAYRKEERPDSAGELVRRLAVAQRAELEPVKEALPPGESLTQPKPKKSKANKSWLVSLAVVVLVTGVVIYSAIEIPQPVPVPAPTSAPVKKPIEPAIKDEVVTEQPSAKPNLPPVQNIHGWSADKVKTLQNQTAAALGMEVEFQDKLENGSRGPTLVVIPAGEFLMGSPDDEEGRGDNERQHEVRIEQPFAIGKYEVTVGQFRAFVEAKDYKTEAERGDGCYSWTGSEWKPDKQFNWRNPGYSQDEDHPVVCVSWNDAVAYAEWLSKQTGQLYRLPTEAEWEYASRAGTTTARYWGDDSDEGCAYANGADQTAKAQFGWSNVVNCQDGYAYTAPVGYFRTNGWDLHDMLGNVWEWICLAYEENYGGSEQECVGKNHTGPRVLRGGSWYGYPRWVRAADRVWFPPGGRLYDLGFRLARQF